MCVCVNEWEGAYSLQSLHTAEKDGNSRDQKDMRTSGHERSKNLVSCHIDIWNNLQKLGSNEFECFAQP